MIFVFCFFASFIGIGLLCAVRMRQQYLEQRSIEEEIAIVFLEELVKSLNPQKNVPQLPRGTQGAISGRSYGRIRKIFGIASKK